MHQFIIFVPDHPVHSILHHLPFWTLVRPWVVSDWFWHWPFLPSPRFLTSHPVWMHQLIIFRPGIPSGPFQYTSSSPFNTPSGLALDYFQIIVAVFCTKPSPVSASIQSWMHRISSFCLIPSGPFQYTASSSPFEHHPALSLRLVSDSYGRFLPSHLRFKASIQSWMHWLIVFRPSISSKSVPVYLHHLPFPNCSIRPWP